MSLAAHSDTPRSRRGEQVGRLSLYLILYSALLSHTYPLPGVSIADLGFALGGSGLLYNSLASGRHLRFPRYAWWLLLLANWSVIGAGLILTTTISAAPFSVAEFVKSLAKLFFYGAVSVLLWNHLRQVSTERRSKILMTLLTVNAAIGLYAFLAMTTPLDLPYRFLWWGSGRGDEAAVFAGIVRVRGTAGEPAWYALFQVLGLGAVTLSRGERPVSIGRGLLIVASILLTFSLTGYALLALLLVLVLSFRRQAVAWQREKRKLAVMAAIALVIPIAFLAARPEISRQLVDMAAGKLQPKRSGAVRLVGSWQAATDLYEMAPLTGVGLGNFDVGFPLIRPGLTMAREIDPDAQGWNMAAYLLATTGVPGLLCLVALILCILRRNVYLGTLLVAVPFADGTFLGPVFWLFYTIFAAPDREEEA